MNRRLCLACANVSTRFAIFFLAALLLNPLPLSAFAEEQDVDTISVSETEAGDPAGSEGPAFNNVYKELNENEIEPLSFSGAYTPLGDNSEDPNYILVEKTFCNLPPDLIPDEFQVIVSSVSGSVYKLNRENILSQAEDSEGNTVWSWRIIGVGTGMYTVSEHGETVSNYSLTKSGEGTVDVKAADIAISVPVHETTCSHTNWPVRVDGDSNVLFAATLTQGGIAVISRSPLSASLRAAVSNAVLRINGPWKNPVYFYSIEEQLQSGAGFELNGASITYSPSNGEIIIDRTRSWQHVATLQYSVSEADTPEISLTNIYSRATSFVTVQKAAVGNMADRDKPFDFTVSVTAGGEDAAFTINDETYTGRTTFSLKHDESILIDNVPVGAQVIVTEADYTEYRYTTSCTTDHLSAVSGSEACIPNVTEEGHSILFTNRKEAVPDTGVWLDSTPHLMVLGTVIIGLILLFLPHHGKRGAEKKVM